MTETPQRSAIEEVKRLTSFLDGLSLPDKVTALNTIRLELAKISPFCSEPVDRVVWVNSDLVEGNDYNPNSVAPPEMLLLEHSIKEDGYTQPIVAWKKEDGRYEVVDGFHRNRVGKESTAVRERVNGFLPLVVINGDRSDVSDRMASTIRHNRARGKHRVEAMSDIVVELKRRNWSDARIATNLGMDEDEVLRLCQITGMAELFADADFSKSWDIGFEESVIDFSIEPTDEEDA